MKRAVASLRRLGLISCAALLPATTLAAPPDPASAPPKPIELSAVAAQAGNASPAQPPVFGQGTLKLQPPPQDPNAPIIGEITVTGNKTLNEFAIISLSGAKVGDPFTEETLFEMQRRLVLSGYFGQHSNSVEEGVRVYQKDMESAEGPPKKQVLIEVDENDTIRGVEITNSGPIKPEAVRDLLHITENRTVWNPNQFLRDTADIQDLYNKQGYIVTIGNETGFDANRPGIFIVDLLVTRVKEIRINKNRKTKRHVILREMRTKENDYYNRTVFQADLRRLFNLDLFDDINPAESTVSAGQVVLTLNMTEKRTGIISAGIGFSNRAQLVGRVEITETNFRGLGQTVNLLWQAGGAARQRNSIELGFTEPWLDRRHTLLNVQLYDRTVFRFANSFFNVNDPQSAGRYNEQRLGGTVTLNRPFRESYRGSLSFRGEKVTTDLLELTPQNLIIIQDGPIFSLTGSIQHDTRDLILDPATGNVQIASIEVGTANLSAPRLPTNVQTPANGVYGMVNFAKVFLEFRNYFSLQGPRRRVGRLDESKSVVAFRLQLGTILGTSPYFEQFFIGGAESLRGYREGRFWGNNVLLGSVEFRQPIVRGVTGVVFVDAGSAWGGPYGGVELAGFTQSGFNIAAGVGLGLRVRTPLGPLRFDYGFGNEGGRSYFSIGQVF